MASSPLYSLFWPITILAAIIVAYQLSYKKPNFSLKRFIISGLISLVVTFIASTFLVYLVVYSVGGMGGGMGLIFFVEFVLIVIIFVSIYWVTSEMIARLTRK